jgi:hypothetical protein
MRCAVKKAGPADTVLNAMRIGGVRIRSSAQDRGRNAHDVWPQYQYFSPYFSTANCDGLGQQHRRFLSTQNQDTQPEQSGGGRTAFRLRSWLMVLLFAAIVQYIRRTTSLISFGALRGGVPVQLTHGNESAHVTHGVTMLDIIKRCPSLYGESAKYIAPWWLSSCVLELLCNSSFWVASSTPVQR